jgi:small-conductance mechanosensitive channel
VQNQSRDWVTDKFNLTVGFDTDLEFARKLIKKLGIELAADPEYAPYVIAPIKMQGVQDFGDYGIVIRMKMTTKPGQAFGMKRKFYVRIRQIFKENNITLPGPTVHVQHDDSSSTAAAAQAHLDDQRKKEAAAASADAAE